MLPRGKPYGSIFRLVKWCNYMKIKDILSILQDLAPEGNQSSWDNSGVQISGSCSTLSKVGVALEPTPAMVRQCLDWGAHMIVTHHPLYMKPKAPVGETVYMDVLREALCAGTHLYAAHTSLDTRPNGPAFWLGHSLGLEGTRLLEIEKGYAPVEASFYCEEPISREDADLWANRDGVHSIAQSRTGEIRLVCDEALWAGVAAAIEFSLGQRPLFYLRSLTAPRSEVGFGEVGTLPEPMAWDAFVERMEALIDCEAWQVAGPQPESVTTVAYCGGSGSGLIDKAARAGADVFITGDMKYHPAVETPICVMDVGHFSLEEEMMRLFALELADRLDARSQDVEVKFFKGENPFRLHVRK